MYGNVPFGGSAFARILPFKVKFLTTRTCQPQPRQWFMSCLSKPLMLKAQRQGWQHWGHCYWQPSWARKSRSSMGRGLERSHSASHGPSRSFLQDSDRFCSPNFGTILSSSTLSLIFIPIVFTLLHLFGSASESKSHNAMIGRWLLCPNWARGVPGALAGMPSPMSFCSLSSPGAVTVVYRGWLRTRSGLILSYIIGNYHSLW